MNSRLSYFHFGNLFLHELLYNWLQLPFELLHIARSFDHEWDRYHPASEPGSHLVLVRFQVYVLKVLILFFNYWLHLLSQVLNEGLNVD